MSQDFIKNAIDLFESTKYQYTNTDIQKLASNMKIIDDRNMDKLNRRLLNGGRNILDTFSEHNFAVKLISYHKQNTDILYEPDEGLRRPIDFKVVSDEFTYWIQMKRFSNLERENRRNNIVNKIKYESKKINTGMFFRCDLSEAFEEEDIPDLINFLESKSSIPEKGKKYCFPNKRQPKAIIDFWYPNRSKITSLTLGISGDMNMVEITGLARDQIKKSLINAAGAFEWDVDQYTINLVAVDADKHDDIDICDAVFGTEFEIRKGTRQSWCRGMDGFFLLPDFSNKVAGVISLKSTDNGFIKDYYANLYVNTKFKNRISDFRKLLSFNNIINFKMRPPIGKGNFVN